MKKKTKLTFSLEDIDCRITRFKYYCDAPISDIIINFFVCRKTVEKNSEVPLGYIRVKRVPSDKKWANRKRLGADYDMCIAMDDESGDLCLVAEDVINGKSKVAINASLSLNNNNLYYIDRVSVEPQYRNCGIGTFMMRKLLRILPSVAHERYPLVCLIPSPFEIKRDAPTWNTDYERLIAWYKRLDFRCTNKKRLTMCYFYPKLPKQTTACKINFYINKNKNKQKEK